MEIVDSYLAMEIQSQIWSGEIAGRENIFIFVSTRPFKSSYIGNKFFHTVPAFFNAVNSRRFSRGFLYNIFFSVYASPRLHGL